MSLQSNDLRNLVSTKINIDDYSSKMGDDAEVCVFNFTVKYFEPAKELTSFIEKGYDWVLDADTSSGEMEDGSYLVFVEVQRRPTIPDHIIRLLQDLQNVTDNKVEDYEFKYHKTLKFIPCTKENLEAVIPLDPDKYRQINGETDPHRLEAQKKAKEEKKEPEEKKQEEPKEESKEPTIESYQRLAGIAPKVKVITDPVLKHFVNLSKR